MKSDAGVQCAPETGEETVHVLRYGWPLCDFSPDVPGKWPPGHVWVTLSEKKAATCRSCREAAAS